MIDGKTERKSDGRRGRTVREIERQREE